MAAQLDLVIMTVSSAFGTSATIPLSNAATVNGVTFLSFASAGATGGQSVDYSILDTGNSEIGTATYTSSNTTLTNRTPTRSTSGSSYIVASSAALVLCTLRAETVNTFVNFVTRQVFTSSGTYTPTTGMLYCDVEAIGGGAGGGGAVASAATIFCGGGGGSGGYSRSILTSTIGAQPVVPGAGGAGGAGTTNGSSGGSTIFGSSLVSARGGSGGLFGSGAQVGIGGAGAVTGIGNVTAAGTGGANGSFDSLDNNITAGGGAGGPSMLGGGAVGVNVGNGTAGSNYGAGGSGAAANSTAARTGGAGSNGVIIVTEFCHQ